MNHISLTGRHGIGTAKAMPVEHTQTQTTADACPQSCLGVRSIRNGEREGVGHSRADKIAGEGLLYDQLQLLLPIQSDTIQRYFDQFRPEREREVSHDGIMRIHESGPIRTLLRQLR